MKKFDNDEGQADHPFSSSILIQEKKSILIVYANDIIITEMTLVKWRPQETSKDRIWDQNLEALWYFFLGKEVAISNQGIFISQRKYTLHLPKEIGKLASKLPGTSLELNWKEKGIEDNQDKKQYQRLVGKLIYLSPLDPT